MVRVSQYQCFKAILKSTKRPAKAAADEAECVGGTGRSQRAQQRSDAWKEPV